MNPVTFPGAEKGSLLDLTDFHTLPPLSSLSGALSRAAVPNSDLTRAESLTTGLPDAHFFIFLLLVCLQESYSGSYKVFVLADKNKVGARPPETPVWAFNMRGFKQGERCLL